MSFKKDHFVSLLKNAHEEKRAVGIVVNGLAVGGSIVSITNFSNLDTLITLKGITMGKNAIITDSPNPEFIVFASDISAVIIPNDQ